MRNLQKVEVPRFHTTLQITIGANDIGRDIDAVSRSRIEYGKHILIVQPLQAVIQRLDVWPARRFHLADNGAPVLLSHAILTIHSPKKGLVGHSNWTPSQLTLNLKYPLPTPPIMSDNCITSFPIFPD
jgi:hypothetical protein